MESVKFPIGEVIKFKDMVDYQSGSVVSRIVLKKNTGNITLFAFDEGQVLSEHTAPFDAVVQVLEGSAEIIIGGKPNIVKNGETIIMPAEIPHELRALESFKMLLTMIKS